MLNEGSDCKIGYIGAFPTATAYNDVNGLLLGARTINPTATVQAVMISSFFDPPKATAAANALLGEDINFLFAVMDEPSFLQVANDAGVWAGGVEHRRPRVRSRRLRQHPAARLRAVLHRAGRTRRSPGRGTAKTEPDLLPLDLGTGATRCPADVSAAVDELRPQLLDGTLNPYTGPIVDNQGTERLAEGESLDDQQAYLIDWAVEGVSGVDG